MFDSIQRTIFLDGVIVNNYIVEVLFKTIVKGI